MKKLDTMVNELIMNPLKGRNRPNEPPVLQKRLNAIFENFEHNNEFDSSLHTEWRFYAPQACRPVSCQLYKLVRDQVNSSSEAREALTHLAKQIDTLNTKIYHQKASEEELLCYFQLLRLLSQILENNISCYAYYLPLDDEEEEAAATDETRLTYVESDNFLFEAIHVLMMLLAYYYRAALEENGKTGVEPFKRKSRSFLLCTEVLSEIQTLAKQYITKSKKLRYVQPIQSMSNTEYTATAAATETEEREKISPILFVDYLLGGESSIKARASFCNTKRYEMCYRGTNIEEKGWENRLSAIAKGYEEAYTYAAQYSTKNQLYLYCRFMAHYWFCTLHYKIAKEESMVFLDSLLTRSETPEQLEIARETLARLLFVLEEIRTMETNESISLLDKRMRTEYNSLVNNISSLTKSIDEEIYKKRELTEKLGLDFNVSPHGLPTRETPLFVELRQKALNQFLENDPECKEGLRHIRNIQNTPSKQTSSTNDQKECALQDYPPEIANALAKGQLMEREIWIKYLLARYSLTDGEFEPLGSDLYECLKREEVDVREALKKHQ